MVKKYQAMKLSVIIGICLVTVTLVFSSIYIWIFRSEKLPYGLEVKKSHSNSKPLVSNSSYYEFHGDREGLYSNVIIGPYVDWVKSSEGYIYGYNSNNQESLHANLSPDGYFLIDYEQGNIYYLNQKNLGLLLGGKSPKEIGLLPNVSFIESRSQKRE